MWIATGRTWLRRALAAGALMVGWAGQGRADTYAQYLANKTEDRAISESIIRRHPEDRAAQQRGEDEAINRNWEFYLFQQKLIPAVGQPSYKASYPTAAYDDGDTGTLMFHFISPATGLPTDGPAIASVLYEVNEDPETPGYTTLGISTDAATDFSFSYTVAGFEPDIQAIPFDASGAPIFLPGFDGSNVAVGSVTIIAPEPSALLLLGLGAAGMIVLNWGQRRRRGVHAVA